MDWDPTGYQCQAMTGSIICGVDTGVSGGVTSQSIRITDANGDNVKIQESHHSGGGRSLSISVNGADLGQMWKGAVTRIKEGADAIGKKAQNLVSSTFPHNADLANLGESERAAQEFSPLWAVVGGYNNLAVTGNGFSNLYLSSITGDAISNAQIYPVFGVPRNQTRSAAIGEGLTFAATLFVGELRAGEVAEGLRGAGELPGGMIKLQGLAQEIRLAGTHPISRTRRTIAVGEDADGALFAGSSNGFDSGQRAAAARLGVTCVSCRAGSHAEENLIREVPNLRRVGTSSRSPCGAGEHNCAGQLRDRGIQIENP